MADPRAIALRRLNAGRVVPSAPGSVEDMIYQRDWKAAKAAEDNDYIVQMKKMYGEAADELHRASPMLGMMGPEVAAVASRYKLPYGIEPNLRRDPRGNEPVMSEESYIRRQLEEIFGHRPAPKPDTIGDKILKGVDWLKNDLPRVKTQYLFPIVQALRNRHPEPEDK